MPGRRRHSCRYFVPKHIRKIRAKIGEPEVLLQNGTICTQRHMHAPIGIRHFGRHFWRQVGKRTVEVAFLVTPDASIYNYMSGLPTPTALDAVASTVHLKMKYHNGNGKVVTIHADLGGTQRLC
ncbi:hypothetical protein MtrunA17_Chr8g0360101 [Medicago truncatula]|uniref:Uncharacterized protein n=1 Tax=Medicago truncatula TaxID=3880 RepID=G7LDP6_MEDTR|nr:hypothetical protein MTR_8g060960 [Medicago truncatula]RHN40901.1 hypothetical protein MtrunA17_Chr8g0360101 [Medicago truncatula]